MAQEPGNLKHADLPAPFLVREAGIYAIINSGNLKIYIGSTVATHKRWNQHRYELARGTHGNRYLQRAFKKSPQSFQIELVEALGNSPREVILGREQFWIQFFQSHLPESGYNLCPKAESCAGLKHGPEYSEAISKRQRGKAWSRKRKAAWKEIRKRTQPRGWKWTVQARLKHSLVHMGIKQSEESKQKKRAKMVGFRFPEKGRAVLQLSRNGEVIGRFAAIAYASKELGIPECNIRQCCRHLHRTAGGFHWRDADA